MSTTVVVPIVDGLDTLVYVAGVLATEQSWICPALGAILPTTPAILTIHAYRSAGGFAVGGGALMLLAVRRSSSYGLWTGGFAPLARMPPAEVAS
jgi:hypothetical protein